MIYLQESQTKTSTYAQTEKNTVKAGKRETIMISWQLDESYIQLSTYIGQDDDTWSFVWCRSIETYRYDYLKRNL